MSSSLIFCLSILTLNSEVQSILLQPELPRFPVNFQFGVATSAYQIEGAWNVSGKSENIWDHALHKEPWRITDQSNGDVAADSYHLYKRDVEMLRELGVDFYRFSLSWTRLLPSGYPNQINQDGVRYYNELIDELIKYNIEPVVTIFHFDLPQSLQDLGGLTNPLFIDWLEDFARVAFGLYGDRVKSWITINELNIFCEYGYGIEGVLKLAPYLTHSGISDYLCNHYTLMAHARVYHLYQNEFKAKQMGKIGLVNNFSGYMPASNSSDDLQAVEYARLFNFDKYIHPIFSAEGDYPKIVKDIIAAKSKEQGFIRSRIPAFTPEEITYIRGSADFLGLNHYFTEVGYRNSSVDELYTKPSLSDDTGVGYYKDPNWVMAVNTSNYLVPDGLRQALNYIKDRYHNPEVRIFENGCSTATGLNDNGRVTFIREYMSAVLDAILLDGCNVTHYTVWTLMDDFEWIEGFQQRMGLYEVDFSDPRRRRTARKSALVYKRILATRQVEPDYEPDSLDISITPAM